jgi:hypothetical protein
MLASGRRKKGALQVGMKSTYIRPILLALIDFLSLKLSHMVRAAHPSEMSAK